MQQLLDHIPAALLVIFRLGGLMIFAPLLGSAIIPARIKISLAFIVGLAIYPLLSATHFSNLSLTLDIYILGPLIAMEVMLGLIIGFIASLPMIAAQTGGLVMGQQMGLGFAQFYNPAMEGEADVVGQLLFFLALAAFLIAGGLDAMLLAVLHSFAYVPPGAFAVGEDLLTLVNGLLLASFEIALRIAAPLLALIFLQSLAMGFIAKTVPQLNILSLGFPLRILAGFGIIAGGVIIINEVIIEFAGDMLDALFAYIESRSADVG